MIEYDPTREEYFGLRKIKNIIDARGGKQLIRKNFKNSDSTNSKIGRSSKLGFSGKTPDVPFLPRGEFSYERSFSWNEALKSTPNLGDVKIRGMDELQKLIDEANNNFNPRNNISEHNTYGISGNMMHSFKKHDDFRHVPLSEAPTIVVWVYQFEHAPQEHTWVVLSGTPQEQHRDFREDKKTVVVRSGSGTENIFEEFYATALSTYLTGPEETLENNFDMHKNIIGYQIKDKDKITPGQAGSVFRPRHCEAVFQVLRVEDKPESDTKPYKSLMENPDNCEDSRVTRIIYGTPYLVQYSAEGIKGGNQEGTVSSDSQKRGLVKRFFGV